MSIKVENIYKTYGEKEAIVQALKGVSFQIEEGEFAILMGRSGCGKSTLLHIIAGYLQPTHGKISFDGTNFTGLNESEKNNFRKEHIAVIFQFFSLFPDLNVYENIQFVLDLNKKNKNKDELLDLLKLLGIDDKINKYPSELSGGQQQRVAIARALILDPKIIIADEPTGNLDSETSEEVLNLLLEMKDRFNISILMATHSQEVASYADRIILMNDGQISDIIYSDNK